MNILITGANGQVGSELNKLSSQYAHQYYFTDREELDICNAEEVQAFFAKNNIQYCLNCAAYTAVDKAESDAEMAEKVNVLGAKNLAEACAKQGAKMIQLSTDYVYHNSQNTPFKEDDETNPQSVYARTKLDGDVAVLAACESIVIRTSWVYSTFGNNFVKTMLRLGTDRDKLTIIFDQIGTPTYAEDLAKAMLDIIDKVENSEEYARQFKGIYHYSNEGVTSWYDFAQAIFAIENIECNVLPIETKDYPTPAKRPPFSLLNKAKIRTAFDLEIPYWRESLEACLRDLKA